MRSVAARVLAGLTLLAAAALAQPMSTAEAAPDPVNVVQAKIAFGKVHYNRSVTKTINVKIAAGWALDHVTSGDDFPTGTPVNCGPGSQSCKIPQTFAPSSLGDQTEATRVYVCRISDGQCAYDFVLTTGTGTSPVQFLPGKVTFGNVKVGATAEKKMHLNVDNGIWVTGHYNPGPFDWQDDNCFVAQGPNCTVTASFAPVELGPVSGALVFTLCPTSGFLPCIDVPVPATGTSVAPVKFLPSKVAFGNVPVGTTKYKQVNLTIDDGWFLNGGLDDGDFSWGDSTCLDQPHCSVKASFSPSVSGVQSGPITFRMCRSGGPHPPPSCVVVDLPATGKGV